MTHFCQIVSELLLTVIDKTRQKKIQRLSAVFRGKVEWKHEITTTYMSLRCKLCALADSWTVKCPVLCNLFRCFDPIFKENVLCHPAFVIGDLNICRNSYSQGRLKSRKSYHCCMCFRIQNSFQTHHKTFRHLCRCKAPQFVSLYMT